MDPLNAVWDTVVKHGGAREEGREQFLLIYNSHDLERWPFEFRFMGHFGFGGKLRRGWRDEHFRVDCYPEDETQERKGLLKALNGYLADIT